MKLYRIEGESYPMYTERLENLLSDSMDPKEAARKTLEVTGLNPLTYQVARNSNGMGTAHALWMLDEIINGSMSIGKANRWLAWAQCLLVSHHHASLEDVKTANKEASA